MTVISLVPQKQDLVLYSGGANVLNFYIKNPDGSDYATAGNWGFEIYNKNTGQVMDVSPTGISYSPDNNNSSADGEVTVTLSSALVSYLLNNELTYQLHITADKFVILRGGITIESKLS